jgi:peptidyl-tRNA hydrolase
VITRQDINPGYQCVQSNHSIADFAYEFPHTFKKWKLESNSIICLSVKNEEELLKLYEKFSKLTQCSKFFEPDINGWTSICLYGTPEIRKSLSHLPLTLKNKSNTYGN